MSSGQKETLCHNMAASFPVSLHSCPSLMTTDTQITSTHQLATLQKVHWTARCTETEPASEPFQQKLSSVQILKRTGAPLDDGNRTTAVSTRRAQCSSIKNYTGPSLIHGGVHDIALGEAICDFMRNPNKWVTETQYSPEGLGDIRFCRHVPNPDDGKVKQNVKSYRERRTPYSDYQVALKRGICPDVHDDHVISDVETRDRPRLFAQEHELVLSKTQLPRPMQSLFIRFDLFKLGAPRTTLLRPGPPEGSRRMEASL
eukprot:145564-Amphidinium_carterae.1